MSTTKRKKKSIIGRGFFKELFRDMYEKAGAEEFYDPKKYDYDKMLGGTATKRLRSLPNVLTNEDKDDIISEAALTTITPDKLKKYDPSRIKGNDKNPVFFFMSIFWNKIKDVADKRVKEKFREIEQEDLVDEDGAVLENQVEDWRTVQETEFRDLISGLFKFIEKKRPKDFDKIQFIISEISQGSKNTEIAEGLGTSKQNINRMLKIVRELIVSYAKTSGDDALVTVLQNFSSEAGEETTADLNSELVNLFKQLKKEVKGATARTPSGGVITVEKSTTTDKFNSDFLTSMLLNPSKTSSDMDSEIEEFVAFIESSEDIIEEDDSIIGLRVSEEDTRQKSSFRKQ